MEYGLPEPLFEEFGDGFKVTLFRKVSNIQEKMSEVDDVQIKNERSLSEVLSTSEYNKVEKIIHYLELIEVLLLKLLKRLLENPLRR